MLSEKNRSLFNKLNDKDASCSILVLLSIIFHYFRPRLKICVRARRKKENISIVIINSTTE